MPHRIHAFWLFLALCCATACASAQAFDTGAGNLMVVLRPSAGANKQDEALRPYGKLLATLDDGREVELETSWFHYLGDMHIRLVFDGPGSVQSASAQDLARLQLEPEQALELAIANLRRVYGAPAAQPWSGGLMQVLGGSADFNSSYFLDRKFWQSLQRQHPQGLVVAVPRRGGLVYAPLADEEAVARLRFSAAALYAGGERSRVSSALYLFKDDRWSVFQPPMAP
jgi:hypothetical protein